MGGALIPGVEVTIASPAMIGGARTEVTDVANNGLLYRPSAIIAPRISQFTIKYKF
jgi:hypothetical protein